MKKNIQILLVFMLAFVTSVLISACGTSNPSHEVSSSVTASTAVSSKAAASKEESVSGKADSSETDSETGNQKVTSLEEYVKSPEVQAAVKQISDSVSKQGLKVDISADGNKLIYTYTYQKDVKVSANALNSALEQQASTFQGIATSLKQTTSEDNPVVVIRYLDKNGKVITTKEFSEK